MGQLERAHAHKLQKQQAQDFSG
jgi:hypothetical protein